jgi:L-alanine-DL-glutamate epimerase-like enolase superfamily enzyme
MGALELRQEKLSWPMKGVFTISRGSRTEQEVLLVELSDGQQRGRGECVPYKRYGETFESVMAEIESLRGSLAAGLDRQTLKDLLPAGAARNGLDCALWDLEAKRTGQRVWDIIGLPEPKGIVSAYTLSLDTPEKMGEAAKQHAARPLLKLKLSGPEDLERVRAVRANAPESDIIVDANEGWEIEDYRKLAPELVALRVSMIEQPLHADKDEALRGEPRPVKLCADESCHDRSSLPALKGKYDVVNVKLDKAGGLTEALDLKRAAEAEGYGIMVGCMMATSLAMAPAMLVAAGADYVDLDGPLWLAEDQQPAIAFSGSVMDAPEAALWG